MYVHTSIGGGGGGGGGYFFFGGAIHILSNPMVIGKDKKQKQSCIGVTRPSLKIPPTLEVVFVIAQCHKKSS